MRRFLWLLAAGLWTRERRRAKHRRRRPRRPRLGDLEQMDGSHHDWFEGRRGWAVLMVIIDDATGAIYARFFEAETLEAAQETFGRYVRRHGLPAGLYVDQASIYRADREPTAEELARGKRPETQFGRAMRELDVELILARSPQAKGRVERVNRTLQDRLVKALRRFGISDLTSANAFLEETFLGEFNTQFGRSAADPSDAHRPLPAGVDLDRVLSAANCARCSSTGRCVGETVSCNCPPSRRLSSSPARKWRCANSPMGGCGFSRAAASGLGQRLTFVRRRRASVRNGPGRPVRAKANAQPPTTLGGAGNALPRPSKSPILSPPDDDPRPRKLAAITEASASEPE